jgi:CheY-like chemotaxis protein
MLRSLRKHNLENRVRVVTDGQQVLDLLLPEGDAPDEPEGELPRVIFLDIKLPKVDGLEVLRRLKDDPRTRLIPVVIVTSSREERDVVKGYDLGANSYVIKPVAFEQFAAAIAEAGFYWLFLNRRPGLEVS